MSPGWRSFSRASPRARTRPRRSECSAPSIARPMATRCSASWSTPRRAKAPVTSERCCAPEPSGKFDPLRFVAVKKSGGRPARLALLLCGAALAAGVQMAPAARVRAAEPVPVVGASWSWHPQIAPITPPAGPVASPTGPLPTPDVPAGDFAVAAILGQANKESYLHLDATAIPQGSSVQQLTLTVKEDAAGLNLLANMAKIAAYPIVSYFTDGTSVGVWNARPSFDASVKGAGKRAADGTWKFDLTPLALKWASGALSNNGFALVADAPAAPETWQVVWSGSSPHPSVDGVIIRPEAAPGGEASAGATSGESAGTTSDVASTPGATEAAPSFGNQLASPA